MLMVRNNLILSTLLLATFRIGAAHAGELKRPVLLCIPEKFWTCDGTGHCETDESAETLAAWKIDLEKSRYALCSRNGSNPQR